MNPLVTVHEADFQNGPIAQVSMPKPASPNIVTATPRRAGDPDGAETGSRVIDPDGAAIRRQHLSSRKRTPTPQVSA
jgi:hypothetical protein